MNLKLILILLFTVMIVSTAETRKKSTKRNRKPKTKTTTSEPENETELNESTTPETIFSAPSPTPPDYCLPELCPKGKKHIACNNTLIFNKSCPNNTEFIDLANYTQQIMYEHNNLRNQLAGGQLKPFPRAARMAMMTWSDELASVASFNSMVCEFKYDDCRNTPSFRNSGQNLALLSGDGQLSRNFTDLISIGINAWWNESSNCTKDIMFQFPKESKALDYRNFGVMAWDNNTHVGCAAVYYLQRNISYFKLTCNYAVNYIPEAQVYRFKTRSCKSGFNKRFKRLCSPKEIFVETK